MLNILLMSPPPGGESPNMIFTILPWLPIFVFFYFFMIRPKTQKVKKQELFKKGLSKGDVWEATLQLASQIALRISQKK